MKSVVVKIILFAICVSLIIGVIIPIASQIKLTGEKSFNSIKNMNDNIKEGT